MKGDAEGGQCKCIILFLGKSIDGWDRAPSPHSWIKFLKQTGSLSYCSSFLGQNILGRSAVVDCVFIIVGRGNFKAQQRIRRRRPRRCKLFLEFCTGRSHLRRRSGPLERIDRLRHVRIWEIILLPKNYWTLCRPSVLFSKSCCYSCSRRRWRSSLSLVDKEAESARTKEWMNDVQGDTRTNESTSLIKPWC